MVPLQASGEQRVIVGSDNSVRLWSVGDGKLVRELKGHANAVFALAFSPDGSRLASGGFDGALLLWNVADGQQLARTEGKSWIFKVAFAPDGQTVFTSGGNARHAPTDPKIVDYPAERVRLFKIVSEKQAAKE